MGCSVPAIKSVIFLDASDFVGEVLASNQVGESASYNCISCKCCEELYALLKVLLVGKA